MGVLENFGLPGGDLVRDERESVVRWSETLVARTCGAWAVSETSHPPTFYLPFADVAPALLQHAKKNGPEGPSLLACWRNVTCQLGASSKLLNGC
jgi:hypothetical protein